MLLWGRGVIVNFFDVHFRYEQKNLRYFLTYKVISNYSLIEVALLNFTNECLLV